METLRDYCGQGGVMGALFNYDENLIRLVGAALGEALKHLKHFLIFDVGACPTKSSSIWSTPTITSKQPTYRRIHPVVNWVVFIFPVHSEDSL